MSRIGQSSVMGSINERGGLHFTSSSLSLNFNFGLLFLKLINLSAFTIMFLYPKHLIPGKAVRGTCLRFKCDKVLLVAFFPVAEGTHTAFSTGIVLESWTERITSVEIATQFLRSNLNYGNTSASSYPIGWTGMDGNKASDSSMR
ncbi:hypothetical protein OUZ56_030658 [Daphnia magna]|uniref:Uncharacterized protein n=1 Tax=Daphnia magna TaxID=35525 RepID=A0ABQ9ZT85_9CRUS|nr:hypothetical protein OUZ56_030658 [Daphnia magna]